MAEALLDCIQSADMDLRPDLYKHIVLSGGTTMFPGLPRSIPRSNCSIIIIIIIK